MILFEYGYRRSLDFCSGEIVDLQEFRILPPHHKLKTERWLHRAPLILARGCCHIETPLRHGRFKFAASFQELLGIEGGSLQVEGVDPLQGLLVV